ncbi:DUF6351 family protein [Streptomyces sp. enrichment culture]|uniref:DUF6351 family protein n=1 Tax=Streptomyces sp. enrichment culture TaxID=1795815 RepID=UPI003F579CF1
MAIAVPALSAPEPKPSQASGLTVTTVANPRPQLISDTSTLIRVTSPGETNGRIDIEVNGRDISNAFERQDDGSYLGMVAGLRQGANKVIASDGKHQSVLRITGHSITGPVFSGPQQRPFYCETTVFGLGDSDQPDCSAPTKVTYQYRTTRGEFKVLADRRSRPDDLATAKVDKRTVPYIVRLETGTINRAVYQIAALYDGSDPTPLHRSAHWNKRLVYAFGGGCNGGYHQGNVTGGVLNDLALSQGYAVASSTLNVLDQNCSTVLSAETAMMVKEHFINVYGPVDHTIGWGASGGAIQQYDIADAYPGILDGIITGMSFPDPLATATRIGDCSLLANYFADHAFTAPERQAVAGFVDYSTCASWSKYFANRFTPTDSCNKQLISPNNAIPASAMWDPKTNPLGVRCSIQQQLGNQLGIDARTGLAPLPYDNTGVQYGLSALNDGTISPEQFIALNRGIGGIDQLGKPTPKRSSAKSATLAKIYRQDLLASGAQGLRTTPIIDQRTYLDKAGDLADIHTAQWSYAMRARLEKANGTADNQVIIENGPSPQQQAGAGAYALQAMDNWLTNITADTSGRSAREKAIMSKPEGLGDGCYLATGERIRSSLTVPASGPCATLYPIGSDPRGVSGAPLASDVLKCHLRPVDFADYQVPLNETQVRALKAVFPHGVCDYSRPGKGQMPPMGSWLSYGDGSVGTFGQAPPPRRIDDGRVSGSSGPAMP